MKTWLKVIKPDLSLLTLSFSLGDGGTIIEEWNRKVSEQSVFCNSALPAGAE